jgi:hypothetical protein
MGEKKTTIARDWHQATTRRQIRDSRQVVEVVPEDIPGLIGKAEAAQLLGCHYKSIELHIERGLKGFRLGKRWKTTRRFVAEYLNGNVEQHG